MRTLRVAVHVHSEWSYDGRWSLERISQAFGRRGYDAVLMAEHDRGFDEGRWRAYRAACAAAGPGARLVPGIEYSDPANAVHVPVWGDIPFLGEGLETAELLPRAVAAGGVAVLAHPGRRDAGRTLDRGLLRHLAGIEIWNRKYDGVAPNRIASELARTQPHLVEVVSLDFHTARQFHPLAMLCTVDGQAGMEVELCEALRRRRARAAAFRLPAAALTRAPAWQAMRTAEHTRRRLARHVRAVSRAVR